MIDIPTTLVLGAGASKPYGFPTGEELGRQVLGLLADTTSASFRLLSSIRDIAPDSVKDQFDPLTIIRFRDAFSRSGQLSVDAFLEHRQDFLAVGKAAIAQVLIPLERPDAVFDTRDWYHYLNGFLSGHRNALHRSALSVVTFNYDRSLEHFLHTAWSNSYSLQPAIATQALASIRLVHVHGHLGTLPWQGANNRREYEPTLSAEAIYNASTSIRIVHEMDDDSFQDAHAVLRDAEQVVFLGFGYSATNLQRLNVTGVNPGAHIYGTAVQLTNREKQRINSRFFMGKAVMGHDQWPVRDFLRQEVSLTR